MTVTNFETLLYRASDGIATVTLNQPDTRNALSNELLGDLIAAFETARDAEDVRCVVLTSSHDTVFSSGANLAGFAAASGGEAAQFSAAEFNQMNIYSVALDPPSAGQITLPQSVSPPAGT